MSTELTSLQVMRLVHDTEEAAVAPLREVAGESVRWLRPRALSEVCASLLREAGRAVQVEREASSRLRDSLTLSDQREAALAKARDNIMADWQTVTKERDQARALVLLVNAGPGDVWYWQGDGADYPESLSCPVVMSAGTLRGLCASAEQVRQVRAVAFGDMTGVAAAWDSLREIRRILGHDGVEDPAVEPAPDAPPAEYAKEADALGVQVPAAPALRPV